MCGKMRAKVIGIERLPPLPLNNSLLFIELRAGDCLIFEQESYLFGVRSNQQHHSVFPNLP